MTSEQSLTKLHCRQIADSPSYCYIQLTILHLAEEGGRRSISTARDETAALSWQRVQSYICAEKISLCIQETGLRALLMKNICVCATISCMQLLRIVGAAVYHGDRSSVNPILATARRLFCLHSTG